MVQLKAFFSADLCLCVTPFMVNFYLIGFFIGPNKKQKKIPRSKSLKLKKKKADMTRNLNE